MEMKRLYDVLSLGVSCCDFIFCGMPKLPAPGEEVYCRNFAVNAGGAANTAFAFSRLVPKSVFVSLLGDDAPGRLAAARMREVGMPMEGVRIQSGGRTTVSAALSLGGERSFATFSPDYDRESMAAGLERFAPQARHIHASLLDALELPLAEAARAYGCTLSLDAACYDHIPPERLLEAALTADMLFVNGDEAKRLTGRTDLEDACAALAARCHRLVVKLGAAGARLYAGGACVSAPAFPAEVCDATGAGDNFCAGFIAAWLRGESALSCLRRANGCGALALACQGGMNERLTPAAVDTLLARL